MDNRNNSDAEIGGNLIAVLLDLDECPSNVGEVAAVSDQQLMLIRRDRNEWFRAGRRPDSHVRHEYQMRF